MSVITQPKRRRAIKARRLHAREFSEWRFAAEEINKVLHSWATKNAAFLLNEFVEDLWLNTDFYKPGIVHLTAYMNTAGIKGGEFDIEIRLDDLFLDADLLDYGDEEALTLQLAWFKKHARRIEKHLAKAKRENLTKRKEN